MRVIKLMLAIFVITFGFGCTSSNGYKDRLYTPTFITKIDDKYFIVDCWHHRVLYSSELDKEIKHWNVLTDDIVTPHSLASDGELYVVEDTGRNGLQVFVNDNGNFELSQRIEDVGIRPHMTLYDEGTGRFYVLTANSQEIYVYENHNGELVEVHNEKLEFLESNYTRSMSIIDSKMFFVPGGEYIFLTNYVDLSFDVIEQYKAPEGFGEGVYGSNMIAMIDDYYYLSGTPQKLIRAKSLEALVNGDYEDLFDNLGYKGTPYYFSVIDDRVFLPQITEYSGVISFKVNNGDIVDIKEHFDFGEPIKQSLTRLESLT